jgi:hypothetical protein
MATLLKVLSNLADTKSAGVLHFASEPRGLLLRRRFCANLSPRFWLQTDDVRGHSKLRADRRREHRLTSGNAKTPLSDDNKPQTEVGRPWRPKMTDLAPTRAGVALLQSYEMGFDHEILHEISSLNHKPPCISGLGGLRPVPTHWYIAHSPSFGSR